MRAYMKTLFVSFFTAILSFLSIEMALAAGNTEPRRIVSTDVIQVESPVGTAPRLPYMVWVRYSDGKGEYRQARWSNSEKSVEEAQANADLYPVGTRYSIAGHIIGDDTTPLGYPIEAQITVVASPRNSSKSTPRARALTISEVSLEGENRLTSNRDLALNEIVSWDVSQQLYNYRDTYGLSTEGYTRSEGWDAPDIKLKGHGSGHYMSALAQAYIVTDDEKQKAILAQNITRMVDELRLCQERTFVWNDSLGRYWEARDFAPEAELRQMKGTWEAFDSHKTQYERYGYGYLNAIPAHHCAMIEMYRAYDNTNWVWAPYYTVHKQLAGLIDIATLFDNEETADKALLIAKDMGLWVWNRMHYRTYVKGDGTPEERRARPGNRYEMWDMYIAGEVGGISESLARLSEMVDNKTDKARLIEAANYFDAPKFFDPLSRNVDDIRDRHANQHIPMVIGALRSYLSNENPYYFAIAENFWSHLQGRYCYATGGVGNSEMFRQPYTQIHSMTTNGISDKDSIANPTLNETCCAYNMLKLTKALNSYNPDDARYMDYYERTLYNQIVGSLHPSHYQTTYHYAVGLNASKPWGNRTPHESCCGGTGSENPTKYQDAAYFVDRQTLWVALYLPTTAHWTEKGVVLRQECSWPAEKSTITIENGGRFEMKLRVPYWATEEFGVKLNGNDITCQYKPGSYISLGKRKWKKGDVVEVSMPFSKHIYYGHDKLQCDSQPASWVGTLMYGPLAMTATGVANWDEATLNLDSRLSSVVEISSDSVNDSNDGCNALNISGDSIQENNVHMLKADNRIFLPDYFRHDNTTHYFKIKIMK